MNLRRIFQNVGNVYRTNQKIYPALHFHKIAKYFGEQEGAKNNPNIKTTYENIAFDYELLKKYDKAIHYQSIVQQICDQFIGDAHGDTNRSLIKLAKLYVESSAKNRSQGHTETAKFQCLSAISHLQRVLVNLKNYWPEEKNKIQQVTKAINLGYKLLEFFPLENPTKKVSSYT